MYRYRTPDMTPRERASLRALITIGGGLTFFGLVILGAFVVHLIP